MKRSELFFSFILIPIDIAAILGAIAVSYFIRTRADYPFPVSYILPFSSYLKFGIISLPIWFLVFVSFGLYDLKNTRRGYKEFLNIIIAVPVVMMIIISIVFFARINVYSRIIFVYLTVLSLLFLIFARIWIRILQRYLFKFGIGVKRVIVIGVGDVSSRIIREMKKSYGLGFKVLGIVVTDGEHEGFGDAEIFGTLDEIGPIVKKHHPDELLLADPELPTEKMLNLISLCEDNRITFRFVPNLLAVRRLNTDIITIAQTPVIELRRTPLDGWGRIAKRIIDIFGALVGILLTLPLQLIIAILIKITDPGPIFFIQERVGRDRNFNFIKFRTMKLKYCTGERYGGEKAEKLREELARTKNESSGPMFKMKNDPRVSSIGRFLRKTSLDEVPQFYNVLIGDMSLVGPRPPLPTEVAQYTREQRKRILGVKPGLTGLWQVSGRSDIQFDEWVKLDVFYIENWSIWLDILILLKTIWVLLIGKGAY